VNARGGIYGRSISVVALDDGYEPIPCIKNTIQLLEKEKVFFLSNYVGTPTLTRALPVIKQYADKHLILVGNFTGARPQREAPYGEHIFNIRASYRQEMMALVERFWQSGARKFGVYYQIDAYGRSGTDGVALVNTPEDMIRMGRAFKASDWQIFARSASPPPSRTSSAASRSPSPSP
jgi:ABC-type branched-subunit amino acid transport system substrate-binding protein